MLSEHLGTVHGCVQVDQEHTGGALEREDVPAQRGHDACSEKCLLISTGGSRARSGNT